MIMMFKNHTLIEKHTLGMKILISTLNSLFNDMNQIDCREISKLIYLRVREIAARNDDELDRLQLREA